MKKILLDYDCLSDNQRTLLDKAISFSATTGRSSGFQTFTRMRTFIMKGIQCTQFLNPATMDRVIDIPKSDGTIVKIRCNSQLS